MSEKPFKDYPSLSAAGSNALADMAFQHARNTELAIAVAVVDAAGQLLSFRRMDGVPAISCDVAIGKAKTAVAIASPSEKFEDMINDGFTAMLSVPGLVPLKGGIPIMHDGQVAGAIGISGSTGENDQSVAACAVAAFASISSRSEV